MESYGNLDQLDRALLALADDPEARLVLGSIFRTIHTVKGTCGFLGFSKLEAITHVVETLLSKLRDGALRLTPAMADALLNLTDAVRASFGDIERTSAVGDVDSSELTGVPVRLIEGSDTPEERKSDGWAKRGPVRVYRGGR